MQNAQKRHKSARKPVKAKLSNFIAFILMAFSVFSLFIPTMNVARVSPSINRHLSLLTAAISQENLTDGLGRIIRRGWISESSFYFLQASAIALLIAAILQVVFACMSLGNINYQKLGEKIGLLASLFSFLGMGGIFYSYQEMLRTASEGRIELGLPRVYWLLLTIHIAFFFVVLIRFLAHLKVPKEEEYYMPSKYKLFLMLLPFLILTLVFFYLPLFGWRYAFFDYTVGQELNADNFVAFKWFRYLFSNPATVRDIVRVLKNTLGMSGIGIAMSWLPLIFAVFLNEIKNTRYRRLIQTLTTIPNFISWVLVYAIAFAIFATDGFISSFMVNNGIWSEGRNMLMNGNNIWIKLWMWGAWKSVGWSAIIYIASISGIDTQLYEAATVDGAGRFQKMWSITIPQLMPTFLVLLLMSVANILSNGMDQYLVFENSANAENIMVLDLYVYKLAFQGSGQIPLTTVISMFKSLISIILLFTVNRVSKAARGNSIV